MASKPKITFSKPAMPETGVVVVFCDDALKLAGMSGEVVAQAGGLGRPAAAAQFKGKAKSALDIVAPAGSEIDRLIVVGAGAAADAGKIDWLKTGGQVMGRIPAGAAEATVLLELPDGEVSAEAAADFALGMRLRAYRFDRYKAKARENGEDKAPELRRVTIMTAADAKKAWKARLAAADGVDLARDLVNEPANVLNPVEFARRAATLKEVGVEVEVLDEKALKKLGMRMLLGVGQGSRNESRVVVMRWNGAKNAKAQPVAFIGKGVTFDTGGISIKPAGGMEDMKGDMAGAGCVVGLMHTLAARKAPVNAVGVVGLVENMPDGNAQRPGDIVTSLSGQTIEIINTDAEGRLVLGDLLWYVEDRFKPAFMVNLATLTGAILVALGQEHAGMFCNDDELAGRLAAAGEATGDSVWRMPMGPAYDKMIDSKFADMKNTGGRHGSAITAAQFLKRFVRDVPWAHLDIAGTGMAAPQTDTNKTWASGWGVRLLDRLVADHYEG